MNKPIDRPTNYIRPMELCEGLLVELDSGFPCHSAGKVRLHLAVDGYFFNCSAGRHYIDTNYDEDYDDYIGIMRVD